MVTAPILLGFFAPKVVAFLESSTTTLVYAGFLWLAIMLGVYLVTGLVARRHLERKGPPTVAALLLVPCLAVIATLALVLASARGTHLANQAADGNQIYGERYTPLGVQANITCLDPVGSGTNQAPPRPYVFLGESDGLLVLYDYVTDRTSVTPRAFPLRVPASDAVVRLANYNPGGSPEAWNNWECNSRSFARPAAAP